MKSNSVRHIPLRGKRVLYRAAYDVPLRRRAGGFVVQDDSRIVATLPTLRYLIAQRCPVVILTWLGRPHGRVNAAYSLAPVARRLQTLLKRPVRFSRECVGVEVEKQVAVLGPGEILLLENVRFHPEEDENRAPFAQQLSRLGEVCVFDAFAQAHRDVASISGIQRYLPTVSGFLMEKEIAGLSRLMKKTARPYVAIVGGAKISDKLPLVKILIRQADYVLLGGALANTMLRAKGVQVGRSVIEPALVPIMRKLRLTDLKLKIPVDVVTAERPKSGARTHLRPVGRVGAREMILDIGPDTVALYAAVLRSAKTVLWSGPMGLFELPAFRSGTVRLARAMVDGHAFTVVGGGDTEAAMSLAGVARKIDFVSTGGGAMLEYLSGRKLPGLAYLK